MRIHFCLSLLLSWCILPQAGGANLASVAPGNLLSPLQVRLQTHLTSYSSHPGTPFECVVIAPLEWNNRVLIPSGSIVRGRVVRAVSVRFGIVHERAQLRLEFFEYRTPAGLTFPLSARLSAIDNAREDVARDGTIMGVLAAENPDELLGGFWSKPSMNMFYKPLEGVTGIYSELLERSPIGPAGPAILFGLRCFVLRFPEPEIHLPPGADLELSVRRSASIFDEQLSLPMAEPPASLARWLTSQPSAVDKPHRHKVADIINVAFLGSREQLAQAFAASGWYVADRTTFNSFGRLYLAFNDKRKYNSAPVSKLLYRGRAPDVVFEKSLDTIVKRHHVRVWRAGTVDGQTVWLGAAIHDTGMKLGGRCLLFSHQTDKKIDAERSKIGVDLTFTGCSQPVTYIPWLAADFNENHVAQTDGRLAVLDLKSCSQVPAFASVGEPAPPYNHITRLTRRVILESRSYVFRDNAYYRAYQLIRMAIENHARVRGDAQ